MSRQRTPPDAEHIDCESEDRGQDSGRNEHRECGEDFRDHDALEEGSRITGLVEETNHPVHGKCLANGGQREAGGSADAERGEDCGFKEQGGPIRAARGKTEERSEEK